MQPMKNEQIQAEGAHCILQIRYCIAGASRKCWV